MHKVADDEDMKHETTSNERKSKEKPKESRKKLKIPNAFSHTTTEEEKDINANLINLSTPLDNDSKLHDNEREDSQAPKFADFDKDESNRDRQSLTEENFDILEERPSEL